MDNTVYFATFSSYKTLFLPQSTVITALVIHIIVSLVVAVAAWALIRRKTKHRSRFVFAMLFTLLLFLPIMGILLVAALAIIYRFFQIKKEENPFGTVESPVFESTANGTIKNTAPIGSIKHKLTNTDLASTSRFQALNVLKSMPLKVSVPLLKQILTDKTDDIRLFAYGMLDKQEKNINNDIHRILGALKTEKDDTVRAFLYKQLSENYWNLVYYQLVQGELMKYALKQAADAIDKAITINANDADFWTLRGKIQMRLENYAIAEESFKKLETFGVLPTKIAPYLAEIKFMEKNYDGVREMLKQSGSFANIPLLEPLIEYWEHVNVGKTTAVRPKQSKKVPIAPKIKAKEAEVSAPKQPKKLSVTQKLLAIYEAENKKGGSILTPLQKIELTIKRVEQNASLASLAKEYKVSATTISRAVKEIETIINASGVKLKRQ